MLYAIKLGPVPLAESAGAFAYVAFTNDKILPPFFSFDDAVGLRELVEHGRGQELRCEPALAEAGRRAGFKPAPMPDAILPVRASLALKLGLAKTLDGVRNPELVWAMAEAAAEFWQARPFDHWHDVQPLEVEVTGPVAHTFEGSVMGNAGVEYGLALYYRRGDVKRLPRLLNAGRRAEAAKIDTLVMAMGKEPAFAAAALEDAIGLPRVPVPMRTEGGKTRPVTDDELLVLVAAVRAVAKLSPEVREGVGEVAFKGLRATARVRAPAPAA